MSLAPLNPDRGYVRTRMRACARVVGGEGEPLGVSSKGVVCCCVGLVVCGEGEWWVLVCCVSVVSVCGVVVCGLCCRVCLLCLWVMCLWGVGVVWIVVVLVVWFVVVVWVLLLCAGVWFGV